MTAEQSERRDKAAAMAALPLKPRHAAASGAAAEGGRPVATPVGERWNLQPMVLGDEVLFVDTSGDSDVEVDQCSDAENARELRNRLFTRPGA